MPSAASLLLAPAVSGYIDGPNLPGTRYIANAAVAGTADAASAPFNPRIGRAIRRGMRFIW